MKGKPTYSSYLAKTSPYPVGLSIERAEGAYFWDKEGKKYLDFISGIGVSYIGHRNPAVIKAIKEQTDRHLHLMVYGEFDYDVQAAYAKQLVNWVGDPFEQVYFTNSGTEAIEGSLKLAKRLTGRSEFIAFKGAYHGSTHGSLSVSGNENRKQAFRPLLPDVRFLDFNNIDQLSLISSKTAAVIIEPVQGDAGIRVPSAEFMQNLRKACEDHGVILIFDEIQSGFGRTGKWMAYQHFDVKPDILVLGKALGGGLPLGAFLARREHMESLSHSPTLGHITTFGGNPLSCAAGLTSLRYALDNRLDGRSETLGGLIESKLITHPEVKEIRRLGSFIAVELENEDKVEKLVTTCINKGVIIYWFLSTRNSFRIAPPLIMSNEEAEDACNLILNQLDLLDSN